MPYDLVAGANASITGEEVIVRAHAANAGAVDFAVAVLPLPSGALPWLPLQDLPPSYAEGAKSGVEFKLHLPVFPSEVQTIALVLYASGGSATLMSLRDVALDVGGYAITLDHSDLTVPSVVFAELYRRNGQWKVRAKKDGVFDGIEELGRRLGVQITDRRREERTSLDTGAAPPRNGARGTLADWTGSGSMVADRFLITNAHVVNQAREIFVSGFVGKTRAEPVIVDETNDLALLRLSESFGSSQIAFRDVGVHLGETAVTLGYPLSGLLGRGPQFTSGSVSNLLGPGDDARLVQVTCPIQPGSSGGPVFDDSGLLIAVITATLSNAQNVNFAIRSALVLPLLEAANVDFERREKGQSLQMSEIVKANSRFVWRVECFA